MDLQYDLLVSRYYSGPNDSSRRQSGLVADVDAALDAVQGEVDVKASTFCAYDSAGGTSLSSDATVPLATEHLKEGFQHSGDGEVTLDSDGRYEVQGSISAVAASGLDEVVVTGELELDAGSGFSPVGGTDMRLLLRAALSIGLDTQGVGGGSFSVTLDLSQGDVLRMRARRTTGSSSTTLRADGSVLNIRRAA